MATLRFGTLDQFQTVREFLRDRYSEEVLAAALGVPSIGAFDTRDPGRPVRDVIARCLFAGAAVAVPEFHRAVPASAYDAMTSLGLLERAGDRIWCPFVVYPIDDLHLVSDRFMMPDGSPATVDREFVYFALTANTQAYLAMLPDTRCEAFLDMGAGCGAAALAQARYAETSCATDISDRSAIFARFNAALNGLRNVESLRGSLYDTVGGRTFDRIGCHPPYDISSSTLWTFADGGDDGEFVIRSTIAGLPNYLDPGGEFYGLFRGGDRTGRPLEQRIREWLGEAQGEFDIGMVVRGIVGVQDYVLSSILSSTRDFNMYDAYIRRFEELQVQQLVYASVLIRRRTAEGMPLTLRRDMGKQCTWRELRWLLECESTVEKLDLAHMRVRAALDMQLIVHNAPVHGQMSPVRFRLRTLTPFVTEIDCPEWIGVLLSDCATEREVEELYAMMAKRAACPREQFVNALKQLIAMGAVQVASGSRMMSSN